MYVTITFSLGYISYILTQLFHLSSVTMLVSRVVMYFVLLVLAAINNYLAKASLSWVIPTYLTMKMSVE